MPKQGKQEFPKIQINSITFDQLKSLNHVKIEFRKPLTAIMGVNGCGKTTVLHALACVFQPFINGKEIKGENYKFSYFFTPNPDTDWRNSKLYIEYQDFEKEPENQKQVKMYCKGQDRWTPKYDSRPKRSVFYIGIESCIPVIETINSVTRVSYKTEELTDKTNKKVCDDAAYILNKKYRVITENNLESRHKKLDGVKLSDGFKYSALSMGTGEQRVLKILKTVYSAPQYSLILIDEIDLLMHVVALNKLLETLYRIAEEKKLQIVFTTHSLVIAEWCEKIWIQYLDQVPGRTMVYETINNDLMIGLAGERKKPINIYVEDQLSKYIVHAIAAELHVRDKIAINTYGAISNAFTLAAGIILKHGIEKNTLIILDGDKFRTDEDKKEQMKKVFSGTEDDINTKRELALSMMVQYSLPEDNSPEEYIFDLINKSTETENEIVKIAKKINAVNERHQWLNMIIERLDGEKDNYKDIISAAQKVDGWNDFISNVVKRLQECAERV